MSVQKGVEFLREDPVLRKIIDSVGMFTLRKKNDHLAVLVESIISQQLAPRAADSIYRRFIELYPKFPTASEILRTPESSLRSAGLSGMKATYIKELAMHIDEGKINLKRFSKMSDEEVIGVLTKVKGIGRWTAEMFLIFALARKDVLPVHDLGLRKGVKDAFALDAMPHPKQVEKIGERWRPYRTIATWYLWKSLQKFDKIG